jgi:hypothetical protein
MSMFYVRVCVCVHVCVCVCTRVYARLGHDLAVRTGFRYDRMPC